jgi:hypothetical protein
MRHWHDRGLVVNLRVEVIICLHKDSAVRKRIKTAKRLALFCSMLAVLLLAAPVTAYTPTLEELGLSMHVQGIGVQVPNTTDYDWWYGCSPTSAGMLLGHYDRNGYAGMDYGNLAPGGVAESSNFGHSDALANDMIASDGHISDFYIAGYGASGDDNPTRSPSQFDSLADFMGTSQDAYGNSNGGTTFYNYTNGSRLYVKDIHASGSDYYNDSGMFGIWEYIDYAGYGSGNPSTDTNIFNQYIYGHDGNSLGFTFVDYVAEIDAGRPVILQVKEATACTVTATTWPPARSSCTTPGAPANTA